MFGLFGPEKVEFIDLRESILTFRSRKTKHKIGAVKKVAIPIPVDGTTQTLKLEVIVDSARALPDNTFLVVGHILAEQGNLQQLALLLQDVPRPDLGRLARRSERIPIGIRVLSQELPGFRAVTIDLSMHGVQLQCEGLLEVGSYLNLTFELEMPDLPKLTLQAVVVWSATEEAKRKAYKAGLEFTQQHPQVQVLWEKAYQRLLRLQNASVMHRSLAGGDYPLGQ